MNRKYLLITLVLFLLAGIALVVTSVGSEKQEIYAGVSKKGPLKHFKSSGRVVKTTDRGEEQNGPQPLVVAADKEGMINYTFAIGGSVTGQIVPEPGETRSDKQ